MAVGQTPTMIEVNDMASLFFEFDQEEIQNTIPYAFICETRFGSIWNTSRRRRRWAEEFTEAERDLASKLFNMAYRWHLITGVPEKVKMKSTTYDLWNRLAAFCASL